MSTQSLFSNAPATAMRLRSGGLLDLANPRSSDICLSDIACGLSRICRFAGQTRLWYSVAEHSVHAARHAERRGHQVEIVRAVLLHDAAEAYVGDMIRPLRRLLPGFAEIERRVQREIFRKFGAQMHWLDNWRLREIDDGLLVAEYAELFGGGVVASDEFAATPFQFWPAGQARDEFECLCVELGIED
jgi:uncharacterized protein